MVQVITCTECGGSHIGLEAVSVNIQLSKSAWCSSCYNSHTEHQNIFFCSMECFHAYLLEIVNGGAKIEWVNRGFGTGGAIDK